MITREHKQTGFLLLFAKPLFRFLFFYNRRHTIVHTNALRFVTLVVPVFLDKNTVDITDSSLGHRFNKY